MRFLRDWLRVERPTGVALHASETMELDRPRERVFAQCVRGIEDVLGGIIREQDEERARIEASFGLIDSERLTCTLQSLEQQRTRVIIESRRGASPQPAKPSEYVRALALYLTTRE